MARPEVSEQTQVVVGLGHVVAGVIAICLAFGAWLWRMQEMIYDLRTDVAVVKAAIIAQQPTATPGRGGYPAWPYPDPPPIALGPPSPDPTRKASP